MPSPTFSLLHGLRQVRCDDAAAAMCQPPKDVEKGTAPKDVEKGAAEQKEMAWSLTFEQVRPTIRAANKAPLEVDSALLEIGTSDKCHYQSELFQVCWRKVRGTHHFCFTRVAARTIFGSAARTISCFTLGLTR